MNPRFANIPGYVEACAKQDALRDVAFLELPEKLCGQPIIPMTARHLAILTHCGNGFVCNTEIHPEHIPQLLWCISPDYSPTDKRGRLRIAVNVSVLPFQKAKAEIKQYVDDVFMDSPGSGGQSGESFTSWIASLVDLLAMEYGWTQREIVGLPLACVFQYIRTIKARKGDTDPQFNLLSDEARRRHFDTIAAN